MPYSVEHHEYKETHTKKEKEVWLEARQLAMLLKDITGT